MKLVALIFLFYTLLPLAGQNTSGNEDDIFKKEFEDYSENIDEKKLDTIGITIPPLFVNDEEQDEYYKDYIPEIIPEYFLLGTLTNNYLGHFAGLKENQVDSYQNGEEPLVNYLKDYIEEHFKLSVRIIKNEKNSIGMYSPELSEIINNFHDKEGFIDINLFDSKEKIYSYIVGSYYRYGFKCGKKIYLIWQSDSELMYLLLKRAGCSKILYRHAKYRIPGSSTFYFNPPVFLKKYFNSIEKEKEELNKFQKTGEDVFKKLIDEVEEKPEEPDINQLIEEVFDRLGK